MRRRVPLNAVKTFEAVARHRSMVNAAQELCVTPTAVSHQIKLLEDFLQIKLFTRRNSRLILTPDSEACLGKITEAFDLIDDALMTLKEPREARDRVMVAASASFTSLWLMPRIRNFVKAAPDIDMTVTAYLYRAAIEAEQPDISIWNWETSLDRRVEPLMEEEIIPVCSPELAEQYGTLSVESLARLPLIHADRRTPPANGQYPDWARYLREYGIHRADIAKGARFNSATASIDAARAGMGALLGRSVLIEDAMNRGELVQIGEPYPIRSRYYLVTPWHPGAPRAVTKFKDWLFSQVASPRLHPV